MQRMVSVPTSAAWKQLGVPVIVYGRVSVVRVVFPVSAAVCGCGGKCLSVHLQVHQFVARAWGVGDVAAAALGANQTQDQREEAHTWRHTTRLNMEGATNLRFSIFYASTPQLFGLEYCSFYSTTLILELKLLVTVQIQVINTKYKFTTIIFF